MIQVGAVVKALIEFVAAESSSEMKLKFEFYLKALKHEKNIFFLCLHSQS
jgi:hypothetical protein